MSVDDNKFIVFNRDEFTKALYSEEMKLALNVMPLSLDDAVVIRRRDVFAPPALDAYANNIVSTIEALKTIKDRVGKLPLSITITIDRLQEIADYFHAQANLAWQENRKLPD